MDWAELPVVDFSGVDTPKGLAKLTSIVRDAMHECGFMYVINHGLSVSQVSRFQCLNNRDGWTDV